jgi:uncharacterized integral membrane protein
MWIVKWILFILFFLILVGFALQNQDQEVSVQLLKWRTINLPLWVFIYTTFAIGVLFSIIISILNIIRLKAENLKLQKQHRKVKEELNRLRNASIEEDADQFNSDDTENTTQKETE